MMIKMLLWKGRGIVGFMDAYKRLEKLCRDLLQDDRGISAYIDRMLNTPRGASTVDGWDADLKRLKHYRWVRNQIAHNPDCTEENMCTIADEKWIKGFYKRMAAQKDPLSLYRQSSRKMGKKRALVWGVFLLLILLLLVLVQFLWKMNML